MLWFESKDAEAVKKMSETVAETRDELLSIADGTNLVPSLSRGQVEPDEPPPVNDRTAGGIDSPSRRITTYFIGECIRAGERVLQ